MTEMAEKPHPLGLHVQTYIKLFNVKEFHPPLEEHALFLIHTAYYNNNFSELSLPTAKTLISII